MSTNFETHLILLNLTGCLTYYDYEESFYNDYKNNLGVINLSDIVQINSSQLAKCKSTGFDVHAYSSRGQRDERGVRVYTFNAHIDSLCVQWMSAIVENIGGLHLKQISRPGDDSPFYVSARIDHNSARIVSARGKPITDLSSRSASASTAASDKADPTLGSSSSPSVSTVSGSIPVHLRLSKMFPPTSPGKSTPALRTAAGTMTAAVIMTRNSPSCPFHATVIENQSRCVSGANTPNSRPNSEASRSASSASRGSDSKSMLSASNHGAVAVAEADILKKLADD